MQPFIVKAVHGNLSPVEGITNETRGIRPEEDKLILSEIVKMPHC